MASITAQNGSKSWTPPIATNLLSEFVGRQAARERPHPLRPLIPEEGGETTVPRSASALCNGLASREASVLYKVDMTFCQSGVCSAVDVAV